MYTQKNRYGFLTSITIRPSDFPSAVMSKKHLGLLIVNKLSNVEGERGLNQGSLFQKNHEVSFEHAQSLVQSSRIIIIYYSNLMRMRSSQV